ncbi:transposase [Rudaea cellulosilytica]|uniref:transposase n=1 Tax=Rudaea cellulosilytica TaxID=540746 RepID=UPI00146B2670|nr:transposase [Rudaea cellulosilytica]
MTVSGLGSAYCDKRQNCGPPKKPDSIFGNVLRRQAPRSDISAEIGNACYAQPSTSAHRWPPPRIDLPDIARHIVQRGNDSQACFAQDNDYGAYLLELGEAALKHSCEIHADVQMIHHAHLLATPAERGALSRMTQAISRRYVGRSNARHRSTGASCEGLYKASLVGDVRYASACYRYIELNPARASMAALLSDYRWSSHAPMHRAYEKLQESLYPLDPQESLL